MQWKEIKITHLIIFHRTIFVETGNGFLAANYSYKTDLLRWQTGKTFGILYKACFPCSEGISVFQSFFRKRKLSAEVLCRILQRQSIRWVLGIQKTLDTQYVCGTMTATTGILKCILTRAGFQKKVFTQDIKFNFLTTSTSYCPRSY